MKCLAPKIPQTKHELLVELESLHDRETLLALTKEELRHMFKKSVRGERHPNDCTCRMSVLMKNELEDRVRLHGMTTSPGTKVTKGFLQSMLREHWNEQCSLAKQLLPGHGGGDEWEVVSEPDDLETVLSEFANSRDAMDAALSAMDTALSQVFAKLTNVPYLQKEIDTASRAFEHFSQAMDSLKSKAASSSSAGLSVAQ